MITIPIPQLNVLNNSSSSRCASDLIQLNNLGICQEIFEMTALNSLGITLGIFSVKPPPVICAIAFIFSVFKTSKIDCV